MILIGKKAPEFTAPAVMPDNSINNTFSPYEDAKGKKIVLFFYPLDFTFVCPSEIIALNDKIVEFDKRNVQLVLISVDSQYTHLAYKNTPIAEGGIGSIKIPMVADLTKKISSDYGILADAGVAYRATFLIDANKVIRHMLVNDLPLGRNISEILRMVDSLAHFEKHGEVCPANWNPGQSAMIPSRAGVVEYLKKLPKI